MSINFNTGIRDNPIKNGTAFKDNNVKKKHAFEFFVSFKASFFILVQGLFKIDFEMFVQSGPLPIDAGLPSYVFVLDRFVFVLVGQ